MADFRAWHGRIEAFGNRSPQDATIRPGYIQIADEALRAGELAVAYFGFEDGVNRAGRPPTAAQVVIPGGSGQESIRSISVSPEGLRSPFRTDRLGHLFPNTAISPTSFGKSPPYARARTRSISRSAEGTTAVEANGDARVHRAPAIPRAAYVPALSRSQPTLTYALFTSQAGNQTPSGTAFARWPRVASPCSATTMSPIPSALTGRSSGRWRMEFRASSWTGTGAGASATDALVRRIS